MNENNLMREKKQKQFKITLIVMGTLFLVSVFLGIVLHSVYLPLGLLFLMTGVIIFLLDIESRSLMGLVGIVIIIFGFCIFGLGFSSAIQYAMDMKYNSQLGVTIDELLVTDNDTGTKFVAYDNQKKRFRYNLISGDNRAESIDEIAAVILIDTTSEVVGHYSSGDSACRYILHLKMQDLATGNIVGTDTLYGGEPPESISKKTLVFWHEDYHGSMPSDEKIGNACRDLIKTYQKEKERKARVVLLSKDELRTLMQRITFQYSDDDGWISIKNLISQIQAEMPDFRMDDYPYSAREFLELDSSFELEEKRTANTAFPEFPVRNEIYVRWINNETKSLLTPELFTAFYNQAVYTLANLAAGDKEKGEIQQIIEGFNLQFSGISGNSVYFCNRERNIELSGIYSGEANRYYPAQALNLNISDQIEEEPRIFFELVFALIVTIGDERADFDTVFSYLSGSYGDAVDMGDYAITELNHNGGYSFGLVPKN